ncbi:MAG: Mrp/NBP35 family ATP-binding protein [Erysipelotrichaceae bacterium]|nr:Mrp/NBP35 family ATP-binding protein [Erysipelotrichaceae bacterium]
MSEEKCTHCEGECAEECDGNCENCSGNCESCEHSEGCSGDCESCGSSEGCSGDCNSCGSSCGGGCGSSAPPKKVELLSDSRIKKVIAVLSGKGGVGKSMVTSLLAVELAKTGYSVGILDSDITGPSIQKIFGAQGELYGDHEGIFPAETPLGIRAVSVNMMLPDAETPVLWRGPILGGIIEQFYSEVHWGDLDYLLIDMPPGTGDVAMTVFQRLPVDEIVMVTTPSKLVSMVVAKAINMAEQVNVPIVGLVENMAYVKCDECGHEIKIYNNDDTPYVAEKYGLEVVGKLPIDPVLANMADEGTIEEYDGFLLDELVKKVAINGKEF